MQTQSLKKAEQIKRVLPQVRDLFESCRMCGHRCLINRLKNEMGKCRVAVPDCEHVRYSSATLHFGEEPLLVGTGGSGTVFFTYCNLRCVFCQNYQISQLGLGEDIHYRALSELFLNLQRQGAENINLVTPTSHMYAILQALQNVFERGLDLPIVYNTNGFDSVELISALDGIIDVYLPDMKYMDASAAAQCSGAASYPAIAQDAIRAMYRQVGPLVEKNGVAVRGVIIRHLVLPNNLAGSYDFLLWLKDEGMMDVTLSLMSQYSPQYRANEYNELARPIAPIEYKEVLDYALHLGFEHILAQSPESRNVYLPDFEQDSPFIQENSHS